MSKSVLIYNALCLPDIDIEHLIQGRIISVIPQKLLMVSGQPFALFPADLNSQEVLIKEFTMSDLQRVANDAIFVLQLNTADAIKYVVKHTGVNAQTAGATIKETTVWYKR